MTHRMTILFILILGAAAHIWILGWHITEPFGTEPGVYIGYWTERQGEQVIITSLETDSPAHRANLQQGDVIIAINGQPVSDPSIDLSPILQNTQPGDTLFHHIQRDNTTLNRPVVPLVVEFTRMNFLYRLFYGLNWFFVPLSLVLTIFVARQKTFALSNQAYLTSVVAVIVIAVASLFLDAFANPFVRLALGVMVGTEIAALTVASVLLGMDRGARFAELLRSGYYGLVVGSFFIVIFLILNGDISLIILMPIMTWLIGILFNILTELLGRLIFDRFAPHAFDNVYIESGFLIICWTIAFSAVFYLIWGEVREIFQLMTPVLLVSLTLMVPFILAVALYERMQERLRLSYERIREQEWLEREMDMAREIQQRLLPYCPTQLAGLESCTFAQPAIEVGGDFYDVIDLGDGKLGICIGDVSGKGLSAAFYMARITGMVRVLAPLMDSPGELLARLNTYLKEDLERHAFVTVIYAVYDAREKRLSLARAGHLPVLVWTGADKTVHHIAPDGVGLGVPLASAFAVETLSLAPGDVFILNTDGINEAMNAEGQEFGDDRFDRIVATHAANTSATELLGAIMADVQDFVGETKQHDDITLLVFRVQDDAAAT